METVQMVLKIAMKWYPRQVHGLDSHRFAGKVPELHPVSDMGIEDPSLKKLMEREVQLQTRLTGLPFHKDQDRDQQLEM